MPSKASRVETVSSRAAYEVVTDVTGSPSASAHASMSESAGTANHWAAAPAGRRSAPPSTVAPGACTPYSCPSTVVDQVSEAALRSSAPAVSVTSCAAVKATTGQPSAVVRSPTSAPSWVYRAVTETGSARTTVKASAGTATVTPPASPASMVVALAVTRGSDTVNDSGCGVQREREREDPLARVAEHQPRVPAVRRRREIVRGAGRHCRGELFDRERGDGRRGIRRRTGSAPLLRASHRSGWRCIRR